MYKPLSERIREAQELVHERPVDSPEGPCPVYKEPPINVESIISRVAARVEEVLPPSRSAVEYREPPIRPSQIYVPTGRIRPISAALLKYFQNTKRPGR